MLLTAVFQFEDQAAQRIAMRPLGLARICVMARLEKAIEHIQGGLHGRARVSLCCHEIRDRVAQDLNHYERVLAVCVVFLWQSRRQKDMMDYEVERGHIQGHFNSCKQVGRHSSPTSPASN